MVLKKIPTLTALFALSALTGSLHAETGPGVVRLTRGEYDRLKDAAEAAEEAPVPKRIAQSPPSLDAAAYELRIDGDRTVVDLVADVTVKAPGTNASLVLSWPGPLDSLTDSGPAAVTVSADPKGTGRASLVFAKPGRYRLTARFVPPERRDGDARLVELTALAATSVKLTLVGAPTGADVRLAQSPGAPPDPLPTGGSRVIPASALVRLSVRMPAQLPTAVEKPVILAETVDVVSLERDRVVTRTLVSLSVSRAAATGLDLVLSPGSRLLSLTGPDDPRLTIASDSGLARLELGKPLTGDAIVSFLTSRPVPTGDEGTGTARFDVRTTRVEGAAAVRGTLVLAASPLRQQSIKEGEGMVRADVADLPALARPFATRGARAYRASGPTPTLTVQAPLRHVVAPSDLLVDQLDILTLLSDGSRVDRRRYLVETRRPHFRAPLEPGEEILSLSVDGSPAKPLGDDGWLVARLPASSLPVRTIEVTTKRKTDALPTSGELTLSHAGLDVTPSLGTWTVVLPDDRRYRYVSSTGIHKADWQKDAPVTVSHLAPSASSWTSAGTGAAMVSSTVTDGNGGSLPGVVVTLRQRSGGSTLISGVTDARGVVRFSNVASGDYDLDAKLSGFGTVSKRLHAGPDASVNVPVDMNVSVQEAITVTAEAPMIDTTKVGSSAGFYSGPMPVPAPSRTYTTIASTAPRESKSDVTVYGASSYENRFLVDGVNASNASNASSPQSGFVAGIRSLPVEVEARGKRLILSGPLAGGAPMSVTIRIKRA